MPSEATKCDPIQLPRGSWTAFYWEGGDQYLVLEETTLRQKMVMELVNGPYILRLDLPTQGWVYYVGTDEPYLKLISEGKSVRWLHDLFEDLRLDLIKKGFPVGTSIYRWTVGQIWAHQAALEVFPGSKVEVRGWNR